MIAAEHEEKEIGEDRSFSDLAIGFSKSNYEKMSDQERLELAQEYANMLTDKLGIERCPVFAESMVRDSVGAYYSPSEGKIVINIEDLQDRDLVLDYIAHEAYHAYQHGWVNFLEECKDSIKEERLYELQRARVWAQEFEDYHNYCGDGYEDYMKYATQDVEESANEFSEEMTESFKSYVEFFEKNDAGSESGRQEEIR